MKQTILLILLVLSIGCHESESNKILGQIETDDSQVDTISKKIIYLKKLPELGDLLADSIILTSNNRAQLINSSTFSPSTSVIFEGSTFDIAWDRTTGRITYISTTDKSFKTSEDVHINTTLKEIKDLQNIKIKREPGWGYYFKLMSDWNIAFCVDKDCTGREILNTDSVKWIFKSNIGEIK